MERFYFAMTTVLLGMVLLVGCAQDQGLRPGGEPGPAVAFADPESTEEWSFAGVQGVKLSTPHYAIFTTADNPQLRGTIAGFMEAAYRNYTQLTGLALRSDAPNSGRMPVYLFGSRREWAQLTETVTGPAAPIYLKVRRGGYCYDGVGVFWDVGIRGTYSVASHEGMHQFLHHTIEQSLPIWAEEGIAVLSEGYTIRDDMVAFDPTENVTRMTTLRKAILSGRWRPTTRLITMSAGDNIQESSLRGGEYYSQLWAMMLFIRDDATYRAGLERMFQDAAAGRLNRALDIDDRTWAALQRNSRAYINVMGKKAFEHYIDSDVDAFEERYLRFARALAHLPVDG